MMARLLIALATAAILGAAGVAHADSLIFWMWPGDSAAYQCDGSLSATVADGQAYVECARKGAPEWDVTVTCFGAVTVAFPGGGVATISCN